ncbi:hypothetical protein [Blastopirellula marina]|uniref:Uncharacterized protein n=1 Tax=Blastopirellula marina TaxID=124 RepID=A0A2S8G696_9BACT|nr:hypothetical protein [Blastopirellula marina]PQO39966.1 hypothetical protein C5Y98_06510 [Blastopirellula marina]PTL45341.1 hypothetical protein C5Y97_06510 [Blastopirellula marina]
MSEPTRLVRDDEFEEMGAAYQCLQIEILDAALQEQGIADQTVRRNVCESFLRSLGILHDQGWLKPDPDAERVYPLLCFSRRFLNMDTPVEELGEVFAPSESFSFAEYASGNVFHVFEEDPDDKVETGVFEEEE